MKPSRPTPKRKLPSALGLTKPAAAAIAREVRSARARHHLKYRYDEATPGRRCVSCAICGNFFWHYGPPIFACSPACSNTLRRTSLLISNARARGEKRRFPQTYSIFNLSGSAPPKVAIIRIDRALRRARKRRQQRLRARLKALLATRTITPADLAYLRFENADIILSAVRLMSNIFDAKQTEALRARLGAIVASNLERAAHYLAGTPDPSTNAPVEWGPGHISLFGKLLNKTVPDLSQSHVHTVTEKVAPESLTVDQLMAIASGRNTTIDLTPTRTITHAPEPRSQPHPILGDAPDPGPGDPGAEPRLDPP